MIVEYTVFRGGYLEDWSLIIDHVEDNRQRRVFSNRYVESAIC